METKSLRLLPVIALCAMLSAGAWFDTAVATAKTVVPPDEARTLEDVFAELSAKWEKIRSLSADVQMAAEDKNEAQHLRFGGVGQYACTKKDDKLIIRRDMVNTIVPRPGETTKERKTTIITDGDISYVLTEDSGKKLAQKLATKKEDIVRIGGRALFDQLQSLYTLELQPSVEFNGRDTYVIMGIPREGRGRDTFAFDRKIGVMVQIHMQNESGLSSRTVTFSNIQINPGLDKSHFEFHPPPGVEVFDMTKFDKKK